MPQKAVVYSDKRAVGRVLCYLWPAAEFVRILGNSALGWAHNANTYVGMCVEWKEFLLRSLKETLLIG
jgi:hypothetical protein